MGERTSHPSHSLLFSALHSLLSYIPFSRNHHFNASLLFCISTHFFSPSRLPLCFLISPNLLLFPLKRHPPTANPLSVSLRSPDAWKAMEGEEEKGGGGEKRKKRVINVFEKKINNHRRLGAGSWP